MNRPTTFTAIPARALKLEALASISASFELFCLAYRWGKTKGKIGFHGGKVEIKRPRLRGFDGQEQCTELGGGGCGGLAWPVGHEPDADQRRDAQVCPFAPAA